MKILSPMEKEQLRAQLSELPWTDLVMLDFLARWKLTSRRNQRPPAGEWNKWLLMAGRGFGKTRSGTQWICEKALRHPKSYCAIVAPTNDDLVKTCYEGPAGVLSILPQDLIADHVKSPHPVTTLINGALISGYSAQEPERLRGPNLHYCLADEMAAWQYMQTAYDMINFCLRLGTHPQMMITTTPKPLPLLRKLLSEEGVKVTHGTTYDNKANLAPTFFKELTKYAGTNIGKQEIEGLLLDFAESGIYKKSWFNLYPAFEDDTYATDFDVKKRAARPKKKLPKFHFIIQSYDTAFKKEQSNDPSAGTTWGIFRPDDGKSNTFAVMLLDGWDERLVYPDLRKKLKHEFTDSVFGEDDRKVDLLLIEDKASGQALIPDLQRAGIPVEPYSLPGDQDKVQRAHSVSHLVKAGFVWIPESEINPGRARVWAERVLDQLTAFGPEMYKAIEKQRRAGTTDSSSEDNMSHDDYVDTFTQMLAWLRDSEWLRLIEDTKDEPEPEEPKRYDNPYSPRRVA